MNGRSPNSATPCVRWRAPALPLRVGEPLQVLMEQHVVGELAARVGRAPPARGAAGARATRSTAARLRARGSRGTARSPRSTTPAPGRDCCRSRARAGCRAPLASRKRSNAARSAGVFKRADRRVVDARRATDRARVARDRRRQRRLAAERRELRHRRHADEDRIDRHRADRRIRRLLARAPSR